mgnify:CR=1 FL=1
MFVSQLLLLFCGPSSTPGGDAWNQWNPLESHVAQRLVKRCVLVIQGGNECLSLSSSYFSVALLLPPGAMSGTNGVLWDPTVLIVG